MQIALTAPSGGELPYGVVTYTVDATASAARSRAFIRGAQLGLIEGGKFRPYASDCTGACRAGKRLFYDSIRDRRPRAPATAGPTPATRTISVPGLASGVPVGQGRRVPVRRRQVAETPGWWSARNNRAADDVMSGQMAHTIVLGGGLCGLTAAMMLARDGHRVTVLERDPAPVPADPEAAWERWRRDGVTQFRQAHYLQPLGRQVLDDRAARRAPGAPGRGRAALQPDGRDAARASTDRAPRPGDERFVTCTARRTQVEQVVARAAEAQAGVEIRRGVTVTALETRRLDGRVHVTAVRTDDGERLAGDLVVDAMGRGSALPKLLAAAGGDPSTRTPRTAASSTTRASSARDAACRRSAARSTASRLVLDPDAARRGRHVVDHALRLRRATAR